MEFVGVLIVIELLCYVYTVGKISDFTTTFLLPTACSILSSSFCLMLEETSRTWINVLLLMSIAASAIAYNE
jgi:hypothetical protein